MTKELEEKEVETEEDVDETKKVKKTKTEKDLEHLSLTAKELISLSENKEFLNLIQKTILRLKSTQFLTEDLVCKEILYFSNLTSFNFGTVPSLEMFSQSLDKIQQAKDRISDLYQRSLSEYNSVETTYNSLFKIWTGKFSKLSSDKRREGEAEFILSWILFLRIERKNILNSLKIFYENLISKSDTVSRKITINQELNKLIGRPLLNPEEREGGEISWSWGAFSKNNHGQIKENENE